MQSHACRRRVTSISRTRKKYRHAGERLARDRRRKLAASRAGAVEATRRALIAVDEASSPVVAFVECPRSLSTTGVTCLGAKITRPWYPPRTISSLLEPPLSSPSLHLILLHLFSVGNPFPQTKGSRGPSTSIFFRRLDALLAVLSSAQVCNKDVI